VSSEQRRHCEKAGEVVIPATHTFRIALVTSIHPDFDARLWKYANVLRGLGHEVHIVCPWAVQAGEMEGVIFHPFKRVASLRARLFQVPWRLGQALLPLLPKVDVVHFHDIDILPWMTMIALIKPVIYDVHENYPEEMLSRQGIPRILRRGLSIAVRWMQIGCAAVIRNVVLVADSQHKDLVGPTLRKTMVMNYATVELLRDVAPDYMTRPDGVIFLGSQHENNGSRLLVEIADRLRKRLPGMKTYAIDRFADPVYRQKLLDEVTRRGLQDNYVLLPNVKPQSIMQYLNRCTIAVTCNLRVPQQINGVHTKLFEYMAAGLPTVASDLPHQVKTISEANNGLLAKPEDPNSFVEAICQLAANRERARQIGVNGQRYFIERYSWESQADVIQGLYERAMRGRRAAGGNVLRLLSRIRGRSVAHPLEGAR
jgi:glycosyltransferase involved in cell wall biosynthesis